MIVLKETDSGKIGIKIPEFGIETVAENNVEDIKIAISESFDCLKQIYIETIEM